MTDIDLTKYRALTDRIIVRHVPQPHIRKVGSIFAVSHPRKNEPQVYEIVAMGHCLRTKKGTQLPIVEDIKVGDRVLMAAPGIGEPIYGKDIYLFSIRDIFAVVEKA